MMTSIAFVLGLVPLVIANGAAAISRRAVGTPVFAGMIAASAIGIFLIPPLYVTFQSMREAVKRRFGGGTPDQPSNTPPGTPPGTPAATPLGQTSTPPPPVQPGSHPARED
jgi:hypothetical protein